MSGDRAVEVSVHIAAQPETVFPYFTDPGRYVQWMGAGAALEPVPGGCYRILMRDGVEAAGEFVEIDPPHRLVFTWGWTHDPAVPPGPPASSSPCSPNAAAPASYCATTACPTTGNAITTARDGNSTSTASTSASAAATPARTPTPDRGRHLHPRAAGFGLQPRWPTPPVPLTGQCRRACPSRPRCADDDGCGARPAVLRGVW